MDTFRRGELVFDVRDEGPADGDPVVLLHGFPQDSSAFDRLAPALHAQGRRTLAPDQRGYSPGARPSGRAAYRRRETVDDVLALLDAASLPSAHVIGHDWGGLVGWALAAWHPDRMRTLTSLSVPHPAAMARAMVTSDQWLRSSYVAFFQLPLLPERLLLGRGGGEPLHRALVRDRLPADAADRYVARMQERGALSAALDWYRALPWDARTPVAAARVPTLLVWSSGDTFLGRTAAERTPGHVDAPFRLEVLEGVPHWIPECAGERVAELFADFTGNLQP